MNPKDVFIVDRGRALPDAAVFLAPVRVPGGIEPLVDGVATFSAMERAMARAKQTIHLAVWSFDPDLPLVSARRGGEPTVPEILAGRRSTAKPKTWADLLVAVAELGVTVRVLISDFDPIFAQEHHQRGWDAFFRLARRRASSAKASKNIEIVMADHPATAEGLVRAALVTDQGKKLATIIKGINRIRVKSGLEAAYAELAKAPGLWDAIVLDKKKRFIRRPKHDVPITVGVHHLKVCTIDDELAFLGGLDPEAGRVDTPRHHSARTSWHDVHVRLSGPPVEDVHRSFAGLWVLARDAFVARVARLDMAHDALKMPQQSFSKFRAGRPTEDGRPKEVAGRTAQILKTQSVAGGLIDRVPATTRDDVEKVFRQAIAAAEELVYLENQYVRWPAIADWLIARRADKPKLQVVFVVPVAPEEVAGGKATDVLTLHGLYLSGEIIRRVQKAFGSSFVVVSPIRNQAANKKHATNMFGSFQIYVHSKALIVDDRFAVVGTANANGRSFRIDTEMCLAWYDPIAVAKLRRRLWAEMLGTTAFVDWTPTEIASRWREQAIKNERAKPGKRTGLVVRHKPLRGKRNDDLPDEYANVFDVETPPIGVV